MKERPSPTVKFAFVIALAAAVVLQCGGKKALPSWPPAGDKALENLYPYDFAGESVSSLKHMKHILIAQQHPKEKEDLYLYAYGRGLIDALLYASLLQPAEQKKFIRDLGALMDLGEINSMDDLLQNASFFKEPLLVLAKKHSQSPLSGAVIEADRILTILTSPLPVWKAIDPAFSFPGSSKVMSLAYQHDVACALRIFSAFEDAAAGSQAGRTSVILRSLLPYAFPNPGIQSNPELFFNEKDLKRFILLLLKPAAAEVQKESDPQTFALKLVFGWMHDRLESAMNGSDPLTLEIKHVLVKKHKEVSSVPVSSQAALGMDLPAPAGAAGLYGGRFYPFTFITVDKNGTLRIATEPFLGTSKDGSVTIKNSKSGFRWPGKAEVKDIASPSAGELGRVLDDLGKARAEVEELVPDDFYGNAAKGKAVAMAVDRSVKVHKLLPLMKTLRERYDTILIAARDGSGVQFIPARISPNCPGEGTKVTISLEDGAVRFADTSGGEKKEKSIADPFGKGQVKAELVSSMLSTFADLMRPLVTLEIRYGEGSWSWDDLVAIETAILDTIGKSEGQTEVYFYLLPELSMEETAKMEGETPDISAEPAKESIESFVLKGAYGDFEEPDLDPKLSAYVSAMKIENAATVVLDVARCWGGSYRERAAEALSKSEPDILAWIADYIGEETLNDVVGAALSRAGQDAVPAVMKKLRSPDESIWTGAWYILSSIGFESIKGEVEKLLKDPDPEIRARVLKLLSQIGPTGGLPAVADLIDDEDEFVRRWAVACAGMLGMKDTKDKLLSILRSGTGDSELLSDAIFSLGLLEAGDALDLILTFASSEDPAVRSSVALSLGNMGLHQESVSDALMTLLKDQDPPVKVSALNALAVYGDPGTREAVQPLLASDSDQVKEAAAAAIAALDKVEGKEAGKSVDLSAVAETCEQLDPAQILEIAAAEGKEVYACLAKLTKNKDPGKRKAAVEALGLRGDKKAADLLMKRTKDKYSDIRKAAWKALKDLGIKP